MAAIVLGLGSGVLLLVQAYLLASIIHQLVMTSVPRESLTLLFIQSVVVVLLRAGCAMGREQCGFRAGAAVRRLVRQALLDKLQRLGPVLIARQAVGGWTTVIVEQVEELHDFIARYLPQMVMAAVIPVVMLFVVFPMNWTVGLVFLLTAPLIPIFMIFVGMKAAQANRKNFQSLERLGGFFLDRLQGMETLRLFRRGLAAKSELSEASEDFRKKTMDVLKLAFLSSTVLEFFASVSIAVTAVYLGMSFLGYLDFGHYGQGVTLFTALFLLLLAPEFYQPLRELGTHYHAKAKAVGAAESILSTINQSEPVAHKGELVFSEPGAVAMVARQWCVNDAATGMPLLKPLDFTIEAGSRVAIVGPSGAGKTTLLHALMGFYSAAGEMMLSGHPLSSLDINSWRKNIAWLGQLPFIIAGTVFDNIAFGRAVTREQALDALQRAQGLDILNALPDGLDSLLQEQGGNLSVGQAQRLALARAIVLPVSLLLLDEPTASLDLENEQKVLTALELITKETTVLTVTHRVHQMMAMDQVVMIDNGRLVAVGKPNDLLHSSEVFKQFIQGQARSLDNA